MIEASLKESEDQVLSKKPPYLSYSRINRYLVCPEQYRLYYIENLRPRVASASLVFGQILHQALAVLFRNQDDPIEFFLKAWNEAKRLDLKFSQRESWDKLKACGQGLLEKFLKEELSRFGKIKAAEQAFELNITSLALPLIGVIDLIAEVDTKTTVVDFKTSSSSYAGYEVVLSDQLTTYQLAEPDVEQTALCVLVKNKEPKIEWHINRRSSAQLVEFLNKVDYLATQIAANRFYKRPGLWCGYCDYLPVCLGDKKKTNETLVQIAPATVT